MSTKKKSFSIDPSLTAPALTDINNKLSDLDFRLREIYQKALVKDVPLVESIVQNLNPTPEECKMLSKVFDRISTLLLQRNELSEKTQALNAISNQATWLYEQVGDHGRDIDDLLTAILETPQESESS